MKKTFTLFIIFLMAFAINGWGQLSAGDIAFTAFNADGDDDFAIVALSDIPASTTIYFTDNEPSSDGTGFVDTNEGVLEWVTGGSVTSAGTIVVFNDASSASRSASTGTFTSANGSLNLAGGGDALYAFRGVSATSVSAWLAGIQNEAGNQGANFDQTGLTVGTTFIDFYSSGSPDGGYYSGARTGESSFSDYLSLLGSNSNWTEEVSNGENILPISTTAFTTSSTPAITLSTSSLTGFTYEEGSGPSTEQTFTVEGSDLTNDITLTAPTNYEISETSGSGYTSPITLTQSGGTVSTTTIYTRLKAGLSTGDYNSEDITAASTGATSKTVTCSGSVTAAGGGCATDLIISEVDENGNEKYIEIANITGSSVSLADYDLVIYANGSATVTATIDLTDGSSIADNDVWVLAYTSASAWSGTPDQTSGSFSPNGNDVIALRKSSTNIDVFGTIGSSSYYYNDKTVIRKSSITSPTTSYSADDWTFTAYSGDDPANLGSHTMDCSGVIDPSSFSATASSNSQINLTWTENASGNDVLIAWNSTSTFGTPEDGTSYSSGSGIPGGGTSLGTDADEAYSHTSLDANTQYFYKIWSVDGSTYYSDGVTDNATTHKDEPTNHVTDFAAGTTTASSIPLTWTENDGAVVPDGYLIKASTGTVSNPVDGTDPADDTDLTDGSGNIKVLHGNATYTFSNCSASTLYNFKIYPYTNSEANIDFKTTATVPSANATTAEADIPDIIISEVSDPGDEYTGRFIELFNAGTEMIDFSSTTIFLSRQANGSTWYDLQLTGSISPNETYVVATNAAFSTTHYSFTPDVTNGSFNGSGDDAVFLYLNANHETGTLIDIYGVIDIDGTGEDWDYTDKQALRKNTVTSPNSTWTASEWTITAADVADMTPGVHNNNVSWKGGSSAWTTASNWGGGAVPGETTHIVIGSGDTPTIESGTNHCNNINIGAGGALNVYGGTLEIHGDLVLQSDANSSASIVDTITAGVITYSGKGTKTVQRYLVKDKYHYVSSPISAQNYTLFQVGEDNENDFFNYNETTNMWMDLFAASGTMEVGRGYAVQIAGSGGITKEFTGSLNTGNKSYSATYTSDQGGGVNLIGNPYPCSISAIPNGNKNKSLLSKNSIISTIYFWDEPASYTQQSDDYATYNASGGAAGGASSATPDGYISPCQGFFVRVSEAGDIQFKNNMRTSHSAHFFKNDVSEISRVWINLTNSENNFNEILVAFSPEATKGVDNQYDGLKIKGNPNLAFYSVLNNEDYVIQGLPPLEESISVKLGIDVGIQGEHTFKLKDFENFSEGTIITLEDKQENKFINLFQETEYTAILETGRIDDRFLLHFTGPFGIDEIKNEQGIKIFSNNCNIYIINTNFVDANVVVYNMMGQEVDNMRLSKDEVNCFNLDVQQGYYIIKVISDQFISTEKVYLK